MVSVAMSALVAAIALLSSPVHATFRIGSIPLTYTRLDPIVMADGGPAGHVHDLRGGSRLRDILDSTDDMLGAKCTTMKAPLDKSNYWTPVLYYINPNGTYSPMHAEMVIYYVTYPNTKLTPFPKGMRMIAGDATRRNYGAMNAWSPHFDINSLQPGIPQQPADYNNKVMPNGTNLPFAPTKMMAGLVFPSCGWANQSLDSPDHFSHMSYPVGEGGGQQWYQENSARCPDSHPIQYPQILMENWFHLTKYQLDNWRKGEGQNNLILSNGDLTGMTWHADFVNGWDVDVLGKALNDPTCLNGDADACPILFTDKTNANQNCRLEGQIVDEDVGIWDPIAKLPGCNPEWDWSMGSTKPKCVETNKPGFVSPNLQLVTQPYHILPFVKPGLKFNSPKDLGGCDSTWSCPVWAPWAQTYDAVNITGVSIGTQADVDANVVQNENNKHSKVPGLGNTPYRQIVPDRVVDAKSYEAQALKMTIPGYWACPNHWEQKAYIGECGPPAATAAPAPATTSSSAPAVVTPNLNAVSPTSSAAGVPAAGASSGAAPAASSAKSVAPAASDPGGAGVLVAEPTTKSTTGLDSIETGLVMGDDGQAEAPKSASSPVSSGSSAAPLPTGASTARSSAGSNASPTSLAPGSPAATTKTPKKCTGKSKRSRTRRSHL